jgi:hypothetical protein
MLGFISERMSDRKQRLFAVACCRRVGHLITDSQCQQLLQLMERCDDDAAGVSADLGSLREAIVTAYYGVVGVHVPDDPIGIELTSDSEGYAHHAILLTAYGHPSHAAQHVVTAVAHSMGESIGLARNLDALQKYASAIRAVRQDEESAQTSLLRDILGNPFRLQTVYPYWLSHAVIALAQTIHDEPAFNRLPILADALEEAGCTDAEILAHCRGPGPHVRGCWVVDLILGKS